MSKNYEEMSDYQINVEVATVLFNQFEMIRPSVSGGAAIYVDSGESDFYDFDSGEFDYCSNPSDSWPIIVENNISLDAESECTDREAGCHSFTGSYTAYGVIHEDSEFFEGQDFINQKDENPLRAAMICFLKMKDNEQ